MDNDEAKKEIIALRKDVLYLSGAIKKLQNKFELRSLDEVSNTQLVPQKNEGKVAVMLTQQELEE